VVASFEPISVGTEPGQTGEILEPGTSGGATEEGQDSAETSTSHVILHKTLVTSVQIERLPTETDREDAQEEGITLAPTGNLLITLALPAPDVEKVVFSAEHGSMWLADEPDAASEAGTAIQTRGSVYR
jgi:pilus assembly protein CpaB